MCDIQYMLSWYFKLALTQSTSLISCESFWKEEQFFYRGQNAIICGILEYKSLVKYNHGYLCIVDHRHGWNSDNLCICVQINVLKACLKNMSHLPSLNSLLPMIIHFFLLVEFLWKFCNCPRKPPTLSALFSAMGYCCQATAEACWFVWAQAWKPGCLGHCSPIPKQ